MLPSEQRAVALCDYTCDSQRVALSDSDSLPAAESESVSESRSESRSDSESQSKSRSKSRSRPIDAVPAAGASLFNKKVKDTDREREASNKSWLESLGIHFNTKPPADDQGYLHALDPASRRTALALHDNQMQYWKYHLRKNSRKKRAKPSQEDNNENKDQEGSSSSSPLVVESKALRQSIYHKYVSLFQGFYNEHDGLSIMTMLLHPCYAKGFTRQMIFYVPSPQREVSSATTTNGSRMTVLHSRTYQGIELFHEEYSNVFQRFPDCIILYHDTFVKHNSNGTTTVIAPYTFFCTIPVRKPETVGSENSEDKYKYVKLEMSGYNVLIYNASDQIIQGDAHLAIKFISDSSVPPHELLKFIGY